MKRVVSLIALGLALAGTVAASGPAPATRKGPKVIEKVTKTDAEWKQILPAATYTVMREHGTERAGTSPLSLHCASWRRSSTNRCGRSIT